MSFTRDGSHITWATSTGPVRLHEDAAEALLSIFHEEHDALLREGDRVHARPLRKMCLDLGDALAGMEPQGLRICTIPTVKPITIQVRQLDPSLWGDAA